MKTWFIAVFLIVLSATTTASHAQECGEADPSWQSCSQDSDCAVGENMCGFPSAYNQSAMIEVKKYNQCMGPMISCAVPPQEPPTGRGVCKDSTCRIDDNIDFLLQQLQKPGSYANLQDVHQALSGSHYTLRAYAATYLGKNGTAESVPLLIDALSDESMHVGARYADVGMATTRHRANLALKELTGEDFGFQWNASLDERKAAIDKWKDWLHERNIIIAKALTHLKDNHLAKFKIYRVRFIDSEKTKWVVYLKEELSRPGAPHLTVDRKTLDIKFIHGQ